MTRRLAFVLVLATLSSCGSLGSAFDWSSTRVANAAAVPAAIVTAQSDFDAGHTERALDRARKAREVDGLEPQQRDELDALIERFANRRIEELSQPGADPGDLADLVDIGLPPQLAVLAGVAAARQYAARDKPFKAYRQLKRLETKYPRHHARAEAGALLLAAGLKLADDPSGWWLSNARDDGIEVLEYLVLTYPSERRCDQAFHKLALMYEEDRRCELAIQRHEELLFSHIDSPLALDSQARIPHLRLVGLESPEYDRKELLRARSELEAWLGAHAGAALEPQVQLDYADCLQRLVRSDLGIARFYERIDQAYGARFHAQRATALARETGDAQLTSECERLLAALPDVGALPGEVDETDFSTDATELRTTIEQGGPPPKPSEPLPEHQP